MLYCLKPQIERFIKALQKLVSNITKNQRGKHIGEMLLKQLIKESESLGYWTLQAGIFSENIASIRLHIKCGFRIIGVA